MKYQRIAILRLTKRAKIDSGPNYITAAGVFVTAMLRLGLPAPVHVVACMQLIITGLEFKLFSPLEN